VSWLNDFAMGFRLAVGGSRALRTNLPRLVLTTVGIGVAVAILLLLASTVTALGERSHRLAAREPVVSADPASLYATAQTDIVGGRVLTATSLEVTGPRAPVPPGLDALPAPGQIAVSPAFAELLATDPLLRERFPQHVSGTVAAPGLAGPDELVAYVGTTGLRDSHFGEAVSGFGAATGSDGASMQLVFLLVVAVAVLLVPMLVLLSAASRIGGAERERRLSTLRLAGARRGQVHRIAAGESLAGALSGGVLGVVLYLALRPSAASLEFEGITVFRPDFAPGWPLGVAVALLVPALAVGPAWFGLRRLVIEPLAVLRNADHGKRRLWWRLVLLALGVVLLLPDTLLGVASRPRETLPFLLAGSTLLLVAVPAVMPWVTELVVRRMRGGGPAWQLAVRRLQLDSGTPSRVVAGVVVVLAGVITLQIMIGSVAPDVYGDRAESDLVNVDVEESAEAEAIRLLDGSAVVEGTYRLRWLPATDGSGQPTQVLVAPCELLSRYFGAASCSDGDVLAVSDSGVEPGAAFTVEGVTFVVPSGSVAVAPGTESVARGVSLAVTPAAATAQNLPDTGWMLQSVLNSGSPEALERVRAALGPLEWRATVSSEAEYARSGEDFIAAVTRLLYAGGLLGLVIASVSLLVLLAGQLSERRQAFAAMHASGVPLRVLGRSVLWQNALPMGFGVLVAVGVAIGTGAMIVRLLGPTTTLRLDVTFMGVVVAVAVVLMLAVTGAALPALRSVTRVEALRSE